MSVLSISAKPSSLTCWSLSWFLFAAGICLYFYTAQKRHKENPDDRVVPTIAQLGAGIYQAAMNPDADEEPSADAAGQSAIERFRNGMLWKDTVASSRRFLFGLALLLPAVLLGLHMGLFPYFGVFFLRFILFFDKIIALSVLPILFIAFGIDELSKVMLIVIGVTPTIILDTMSITFESSSMPNAINRIGSTESAMILSKNRMKRRKNTPKYGKTHMCRHNSTAG